MMAQNEHRNVIDHGDSRTTPQSVNLGLSTMKEKPDLRPLLKRLGEPETWSTDLIAAAAMNPYEGLEADMRRIMESAGENISRFSDAVQVLVMIGKLDLDQVTTETSGYLERHRHSPSFRTKLDESKDVDGLDKRDIKEGADE
jgi:hypothetical protein